MAAVAEGPSCRWGRTGEAGWGRLLGDLEQAGGGARGRGNGKGGLHLELQRLQEQLGALGSNMRWWPIKYRCGLPPRIYILKLHHISCYLSAFSCYVIIS